MRRFSSYGPVDPQLHYHAPRKELIEEAYVKLMGENRGKDGHFITVWAPRQCGKTWIMQQILFRLQANPRYHVLKINLEHLKGEEDVTVVTRTIAEEIGEGLGKDFSNIQTKTQFQKIFRKDVLDKPLVLILDEFDALPEKGIHTIVSAFRNIYIKRLDEIAKPPEEKTYRLHAVALIGVRSVVGVENSKGSPFNVQRSLHIPNLESEEVNRMFQWYEKESGQTVEPEVVEHLYAETAGQPGLTCWFGELLTEGIENHKIPRSRPINARDFEIIHAAAVYALPNNNILNIVSKAREEKNRLLLLKLFQTREKLPFKFDDKTMNSLYMNGVVEKEIEDQTRYYLKFPCPFVQKRLFNFFSHQLFNEMGTLVDPFVNLDGVLTDTHLNIPNILKLYRAYLDKNREWLFKSVPRRNDMRIYEAVFHFNLYSYLTSFLENPGGQVIPEFPTGNGKIDLIIRYGQNTYGLELKSFTNHRDYRAALVKAAQYGRQLKLREIFLVFFIETIDDGNRAKFETPYTDADTGVTVVPIFIATGI